jgi:altronate dehydratase
VKAALVISERDNVATALEQLEPGRELDLTTQIVVVRDRIPPGHKLAIAAIAAGAAVVKYGSAIGTATTDIPRGAHVHTHNVASSRGRGDLAASRPHDGERLAEPPDEQSGPPTVIEAGDEPRQGSKP